MILHIPHASRMIPADVRPDTGPRGLRTLERELLRMTDLWTDELFQTPARQSDTVIVYPVSRLVVDPERFEHDEHGRWPSRAWALSISRLRMAHNCGSDLLDGERAALIERFYRGHHHQA